MFFEWQIDDNWLRGPWPQQLRDFLMQDPGCGYFPLLGMRNPLKTFETVWVWTDDEDCIQMTLMKRHSGNLQLAGSPNGTVASEVAKWLQNLEFGELIVPGSLISNALTDTDQWLIREGSLLGVLHKPVVIKETRGLEIKPLEIGALPEVVELYKKVFKSFTPIEVMTAKLEAGEGRGYGIWMEGRLITVAQSDFESTTKSVIVGVATEPELQGRGYGGIILSYLCQQLQAVGQTPCLLYDNPDAGKLYRALGFFTEDQMMHIRKK